MNVMKFIFLTYVITLLTACNSRVREKELNEKMDSINQKEQQLILIENQLTLMQTYIYKI